MKLTTMLLTIATLQVFATGGYSQNTDLTLDLGESSVGQVLTEIENQSEFYFLFNQRLVDTERKVNVQLTDEKIEKILDQVFSGTTTDYVVMDRQIVLSPKQLLSDVKRTLQSRTVTGTITDSEGVPLIGVTISAQGTSIGTISDAQGKYSLSGVPDGATLVISYIGMVTQEIPIGDQTTIDIVMAPDLLGLEEVVVVGYGVQKKVNLSGAVAVIPMEEFKSRPVTNLSQGLQGLSPGLNIDFLSGEPGEEARINIRGITSINGGDPLILIDGVHSESWELNNLNPQDVSDISILKDASSAAIYGARAAFGVILITTKVGSGGGFNVGYSNNLSWSTPTWRPEKTTDPYTYCRLFQVASDNTSWPEQQYSDETFAWAKERSDNPEASDGVRINPKRPRFWEYMGNQDWDEYLLDYSAFSQMHNLQVDGNTDKVRYYLSGSFNEDNGVLKIAEDKFTRYTFRSKIDFTPVKWLTFGNNTHLANSQKIGPRKSGDRELFREINNIACTDWDVNPDGSWANTQLGAFMAKHTTDATKYTYNDRIIQSTFTGEARFFESSLRINADYTVRSGIQQDDNYSRKYSIGWGPGDIRETGKEWASRTTTSDLYSAFNVYTTFNRTFGDHELTALAGFNQEYGQTDWYWAQRNDFISSSLPTMALATGDRFVGEGYTDWAIRGAFYRLNYIFKSRYIIEFNGRYDGSSRFPKEDRFGFFPSASAAWRIDKENFMSSLENVISTLKFRGSYGSLGNQNVNDENGNPVYYGYIPSMNAVEANYIIGGEVPRTVNPPPLVSDNYTWEKMSTLNGGIDLGLFRDRLFVVFDIYQRNTTGMLTTGKELPEVLGADEPRENAADLQTNGWELAFTYKDNFNLAGKPFAFNTRFILSDSRAWITGFDNPNFDITQYYVGQEFGELWGFESDGFYQSVEEIQAHNQRNYASYGTMPWYVGTVKWVDQDGNGIIEKGFTHDDPKDGKVIGNTSTRYRFGFNLNFQWNGFDFSAFVQGIGKKDHYPIWRTYWGTYQDMVFQTYPHLFDFYRAEDDSEAEMAGHSQAYIDAGLAHANTDAELPVLQGWNCYGVGFKGNEPSYSNGAGLGVPQTQYLFNAAYIRLKNITLGYTLPRAITQKARIKNLRIFISGENIATWSAIKYTDPEELTFSGSGGVYRFRKRYSVGINIDF